MMRCGLLGRKLTHSYSPQIHARLAGYSYTLFEREGQEVEAFLRSDLWDGLNVTVPYKQMAFSLCDAVSQAAQTVGNVNTLLRRPDGTLYGDNTDVFGFEALLRESGLSVGGKKVLVLGSGGAGHTAAAVLRQNGAEVVIISRTGENNYENLARHRDAAALVNATPVGMYPENGATPVDLTQFPACEGVLDVIYNPARTALLLQAEKLGIPCRNGLTMLVAQAAKSCECFTGQSVSPSAIRQIIRAIQAEQTNIVLVGMPGCGKSAAAAELGKLLRHPVFDSDALIAREAGMSIPEIFARWGEEEFRRRETAVLAALGKHSGIILSTGGGCVTREENYPLLHQNGRIFWLQRDLEKLPRAGRPLSENADLQAMYAARAPLYCRFADKIVDNNGTIRSAAEQIKEALE